MSDWRAGWPDLERTGPALPPPQGGWWNPPAVTVAFIRAVKRAGVPRIRLHDLKHSSLLLAAGVHPKVVSERLGHSSVAFTLETYAHVMPGMQPEAGEFFIRLVHNGDNGHHEAGEDTDELPTQIPAEGSDGP